MEKLELAVYKLYIDAKLLAYRFLHDEEGDVNIVSIVVLIGIAVLLAIVFKDAIGSLLKTLLKSIKTNATDTTTKKI